MAAPGEVAAAVHCDGERLLEVCLPAAGKASDNILELKRQTMEFMTDFMKQKNMSTEEVDLMEEVISEGEEETGNKPGKKGGGKGRKRKQQEAPKT